MWKLIVVALLGLAAGPLDVQAENSPADTVVVVNSGEINADGRYLAKPFTLTIKNDTFTVNGVPIDPALARQPPSEPTLKTPATLSPYEEIMERFWEKRHDLSSRGISTSEQARILADELRAQTGLIDSVQTHPADSGDLYVWRRDGIFYVISLEEVIPTPPTRGELLRTELKCLAHQLRNGSLVIIDQFGVAFVVSPASIAQVRAEIEIVQALGKTLTAEQWSGKCIPFPVARRLADPIPLR